MLPKCVSDAQKFLNLFSPMKVEAYVRETMERESAEHGISNSQLISFLILRIFLASQFYDPNRDYASH